ncbi:MAG: ATP-binding cassette domain-containing protein [Bacteroidales bacterium]|nr:ATP-binding cassette domain-containing protein [Bacteroidales bacterium]
MTENVLQISNLHKRYGRIRAVDGLSLDVRKGDVFGILGPNGSGKTTTLSIILDVVNADEGSFSWFGGTPSRHDRKRIGAILEQPAFYPYLSAFNNLQIIADIKEVDHGLIPEVLKTTGLYDRKNSAFRTYSLGMKQRLAIAGALLGRPEVLIFDEPTNGLDPKGIAEIRNLILELSKQGFTIILASHLLDEVQKTCTHVAVMNKGTKLFQGTVAEVLNKTNLLELAGNDMPGLTAICGQSGDVKTLRQEGSTLLVELNEGVAIETFHDYLINQKIILTHLFIRKNTLENTFLELLKNNP